MFFFSRGVSTDSLVLNPPKICKSLCHVTKDGELAEISVECIIMSKGNVYLLFMKSKHCALFTWKSVVLMNYHMGFIFMIL